MKRRSPLEIALFGLLLLNMLGTLLPLFLALMSSFKTTREIWNTPFALPAVFSLENYQKVLESGDFFVVLSQFAAGDWLESAFDFGVGSDGGVCLGALFFSLE